jgi:hypothetical protein
VRRGIFRTEVGFYFNDASAATPGLYCSRVSGPDEHLAQQFASHAARIAAEESALKRTNLADVS